MYMRHSQISPVRKDPGIQAIGIISDYTPEAKAYLQYKNRAKNRRHNLDKLNRADITYKKPLTKKTQLLHLKAVRIAEDVLNKMVYKRKDEVVLNHKYLSKITNCLADQNKRHINQLSRLFFVEYKRSYLKDGVFYERCYIFRLNSKIIEKLRGSKQLDSKFYPAKKPGTIKNTKVTFNKVDLKFLDGKPNIVSPQKSNLNSQSVNNEIKYRGHDKANRLNFYTLGNKMKQEIKYCKKIKSIDLWYRKPKNLADMLPILDGLMCSELRSLSQREYPDNFIRQRLLAMSKRPELVTRSFRCRKAFLSYFSKVLINEKHCPIKVNNVGFCLRANLTTKEKILERQEKFLSSIEYSQKRGPDWHFKRKLAATLKSDTAYRLLLSITFIKITNSTLVISLKNKVELTINERNIILAQAKAVFDLNNLNDGKQFLENLRFITNGLNKVLSKKKCETISDSIKRKELPKGNWGKIVKSFIGQFGVELYKHWLSGVEVLEDGGTKIISLKVNSAMVKDRIENEYLMFLNDVAQDIGCLKLNLMCRDKTVYK